MAHLSDDQQLCQLLRRSDRDVFKNIAATWKRKDVDSVTDGERTEAKQRIEMTRKRDRELKNDPSEDLALRRIPARTKVE